MNRSKPCGITAPPTLSPCHAQSKKPLTLSLSKGEIGFTLVEIMMATAAFAIMIIMFSPMFSVSQRAFTALEVSSSLKDSGQKALNQIAVDLNQCKRLFKLNPDVNSDDFKYNQNVLTQIGVSSLLTNSKLPVNNKYPAISPTDPYFFNTYVGNCLFLASVENSLDFVVKDSLNADQNIRIDTYRFSYYYLVRGEGDLGGKPLRNLWEWHSVSFADWSQLDSIADAVMKANTINSLMNQSIQYAWDPLANYDTAFHIFDPGPIMSPSPAPPIAMRSGGPAVNIPVGMGGGSYRYGVSPNTGADFGTKHNVPNFAVESGEFPSGFEVVMAGDTGARMVFVRLVLIANGDQKVTYSKEHTLLVTTQDN